MMKSFKTYLKEGVIRTTKGSGIRRYKNIVGKDIGGQLYVHKNYANEVIPSELLDSGAKQLPKDFKYNTIMWDRRNNIIRFDSAPGFDTEREPIVGDYVVVFPNGTLREGKSNYIWHHKWLWVKDDYKGFNVSEAINWSKEWLSKLQEPASGKLEKWKEQLNAIGLQ